MSEYFRNMGEGHHFFKFFMVVLLEELFARWFFLGLLTKIPSLSGPGAFYALFLIGNGLWALLHISNFKESKDRKAIRVLPQFIAGAFFTYIFVKYGLVAVILAHFASNAVIFAIFKAQRVNLIDGLITIYAAACGLVSYALMNKPLSDILPWFADNPSFTLTGWRFWDYVKVSIFITSCIAAMFGLLLYDRGEAGDKKSTRPIVYLFSIPLVIGLLYGAYALLGLFITNVPYRVLTLAILLAFVQKGASGSAVARTFWTNLPDVYVTICILQALGFWPSLAWVAIETLIHTPRIALVKIDD